MALEIFPLGDAAFVVRVGDSLGKVLATARRLESAQIPEVLEIAPALASVGVFFASPSAAARGENMLTAALKKRTFRAAKISSRLIEIPFCCDGDFASDLELVAQRSKLAPNEFIKRYLAARFQIRCLGFTPGFPYLSGLPTRLAAPRRETPRVQVPAGSVAIGGSQTGIYPLASPGGWNIIGRTPLKLFDPAKEEPALLRPNDKVRFVRIGRAEFERWTS